MLKLVPPKILEYPIPKWGNFSLSEFWHLKFELLYMIESPYVCILRIQSTFSSKNTLIRLIFIDQNFPFGWSNNKVKGMLKKLLALLIDVNLLSIVPMESFNGFEFYLFFHANHESLFLLVFCFFGFFKGDVLLVLSQIGLNVGLCELNQLI